MKIVAALCFLWPSAALPEVARPPVIAIDGVRQGEGGTILAHLLLLNGAEQSAVATPDRLDGTLHVGGRDIPVSLTRQKGPDHIPAHGWIGADYTVARPADLGGDAVLSLGSGREGYAFALAAPPAGDTRAAYAEPATPQLSPVAGREVLANLSAYEPTYAVMGGGTNSDMRVQLSFKYQLFGRAGEPNRSWVDGFHVAYTQKIFWDIETKSKPFRDVSYQPEILYIHNWAPRSNGVRFGVRGGLLHESNGKGGDDSRGYQYLYVQPQAELPIGDYTLSVGPRLLHYVFGSDNNPDIGRYRGHQALSLAIGREDGLKINTTSRYNFGHGKGAFDGDISYPIRNILGGTALYIVVQGFTGYGEDLRDYNRQQTRVRLGLGITR
jgi:outer membrane phospholipase A